ncbi:MAG: class I SAM-dependent methyltransferase [Balneolaceae bacterium]
MNRDEYYKQVAGYFDVDASDFEDRYEENKVLKRIRHSFRKYTEKYSFQNALEIGCGPGIDLIYFGRKYPARKLYGIDIAPGMVEITGQKIKRHQTPNVSVATGSVEDINSLFPGQVFDMIYVYFGALNTVYDLQKAAQILHESCTADAILVLTFVNRNYLMDIPLFLMKGQVKQAFSRLTGRWKGYSPDKSLNSQCFTSADIKKAFSDKFKFVDRRGYSILFPAWYRHNHLNRLGEKWGDRLWNWDKKINHTPLWNTGEYSLYVLKPLNA